MNAPHCLLIIGTQPQGEADKHPFAVALRKKMEDTFGDGSFGLTVSHKKDGFKKQTIGVLVIYGERGEHFWPAVDDNLQDCRGKVLVYPAELGPIGIIRANRALSGALHFHIEAGEEKITTEIVEYIESKVQTTAL